MKAKNQSSGKLQSLREKAEKIVKQRVGALPPSGEMDSARVSHELEIRKVELELQNEKLRRTHPGLPIWIKACFAAIFAIIIVFAAIFYFSQRNAMQNQAEESLASIARLKVDQIAAWREHQLQEAAEIMGRPYLRQQLSLWLLDPQENERKAMLSEFQVIQQKEKFINILIADGNGEIRLSLSGSFETSDVLKPALKAALQDRRPIMTDLHSDILYQEPHINLITPIFAGDTQNQPIGAVVLMIDPTRFLYPLIQSWPVASKSAETLLVRRDGDDVLYLNTLRHQSGTALKLRIPLSRSDLPAARAIHGRQGVALGRDYRGVQVVSVLLPVPDSSWFMVAKVDLDEVLAPWRSRVGLLLALFVSALGMLGLLALFAGQHKQKQYYLALYRSEAELRAALERHSVTLKSIGDGVIVADAQGRVELLNAVAEKLTGWSDAQARGRPLEEVFHIINEHTRAPVESPVAKVMREGVVAGLANHTLLIDRNGIERPIADSGAPIRNQKNEITGVVLVFRDQSEEQAFQRKIQEGDLQKRLALEASGLGTWRHEVAAHTIALDARAQSCYGFNKNVVALSELIERVHPDDVERLKEEISSAAEPGRSRKRYATEYRVIHPGKRIRWLAVTVQVQLSGTAAELKPVSIHGTVQDITERKQAEQALQDSERRYRYLFESMEAFALLEPVADAEGIPSDFRFIEVNPAGARLRGLPAEAIKGRTVLELFPRIDRYWIEAYGRVVRTEHPEKFERLNQVNGRWYRTYAYCPESGKVASLIIDITDRIEAEQKLQELTEALEQRVVERTELAEARAKQLQVLAVELIEAEERERRRVAQLLHEDLQQILAAARFQLQTCCSQMPSLPALVDVERLLKESIDKSRKLSHELSPPVLQHAGLVSALKWLARQMGEQFGLQVELEIAADERFECAPLKVFMFRAVQELLFNIFKHAAVKKAVVALSESDGDLVIAVQDEGKGFNPDILKATSNTGLGLLSLRERASHMGGKLLIESAPEQGSRFILRIPSRLADDVQQLSPAVEQPPCDQEVRLSPAGTFEISILFADDHKVLRQGLIKLMENQPDIRVVGEAANGREALEQAVLLRPDVVVMDISMPEMDGIEATRRIKDELPQIRVIGLSMFEDDHLFRAMREAGAEAVISKTASSAELLKTIYAFAAGTGVPQNE